MATNYPTSLDNGTTIPNPTAVNTQNNPDHASLHSNTGDGLKAVEAKVGIGASTPTANTLLFGTGTGTSAWTALTSAQLAATLSDETGTGSAVFATTPTLVTPKVDTINENTLNNGTTIGGVNIKSGALNTNNSVVTANITDSAVTSAKVATGVVVQMLQTDFSAVTTGTTTIPYDDTIPQSTEGDQYMTQAITPKSVTNVLIVEASANLALSTGLSAIGALFKDAETDSRSATGMYLATANAMYRLVSSFNMVAGTTSAVTFKFRAGPQSAATMTFNGDSATRRFGAITKSWIKITEYKA
jgi:hypothetical protein